MRVLQTLGVTNATGLSASAFYERVRGLQSYVYLNLRNNALRKRSEFSFTKALEHCPSCKDSSAILSELDKLVPTTPEPEDEPEDTKTYSFAKVVCNSLAERKLVVTFLRDLGYEDNAGFDQGLEVYVGWAKAISTYRFFDQTYANTVTILSPLYDLDSLRESVEALQEPATPPPTLKRYRVSYDSASDRFELVQKTALVSPSSYGIDGEQITALDDFYQDFAVAPDMMSIKFDNGLELTTDEIEDLNTWLQENQ